MTSFDPEHSDVAEHINGEHLELHLVGLNTIEAQLKESGAYYRVLNSSTQDNLPRPLRSARLDASKSDHDTAKHELSGSISFTPPVTKGEDWMRLLHPEIQTRYSSDLPEQFVDVPHDVNALYVRISSDTFVRIQFASDIDECSVRLTLRERDEIEDALGRTIEIIDEPVSYGALGRFKSFSKVWLATLDSIAAAFGDNELQKRFRVFVGINVMGQTPDASELPEHTDETLGLETMSMIGGMSQAKSVLKRSVEMVKSADEMNRYGIRAPHFVLHGIPGTGKTSLLTAFAKDAGANIYRINSMDVIDKYTGESAKSIAGEFDEVLELAKIKPVVVILDEIEALIRSNTNQSPERLDTIKALNILVDEISETHPNRVIIAGATNADPAHLDQSVVRSGRLELIPVNAPNVTEREEIWWNILVKKFLKYNEIDVTAEQATKLIEQKELFAPFGIDVNPRSLALLTDEMTGADFTAAIEKSLGDAVFTSRIDGSGIMITQEMLEASIRYIRQNR